MSLEVVKTEPIYESNFRDVITTLRKVADAIEAGEHGQITSASMVIRLENYQVEVFGLGLGDIDTSITLLEQGKSKLLGMLNRWSEK